MNRAFTLIELLVAIVLVTLLLGLVLGGFQKIKEVNAEVATYTSLQTLASVKTELAAQGGDTTFLTEGILTQALRYPVTRKMITTLEIQDSRILDGWGNEIQYDFVRRLFFSPGPDGIYRNADDIYGDQI